MQMISRRVRTRRATTTITVVGSAIAALLTMVVIALPAGAKTTTPTSPSYHVRQILSGRSLGHWYTKAGSSKWHWERLSSPDDITVFGGDLFTTFQNGVGPQGQASADGNRDSTIVEFTQGGQVIHKWDLRGKCDGLTADPATGQVIATINEDANSSLDSIDSWTGQVTHYQYSKQPLPHHGGTDAISFYDGHMLISASAPGTTRPYTPSASTRTTGWRTSTRCSMTSPWPPPPTALMWVTRSGWASPIPTPMRSCRRLRPCTRATSC
jgi:hypothetical protein